MPFPQPPRDEFGEVTPYNEAQIQPTDGIIRRIPANWIVDDKGRRRLSSMAFKPSSDRYRGKSVDIESLIIEQGDDPTVYVTTPRWIGSIRYEAGNLHTAGFCIGWDPLPDNPCHGAVWGTFTNDQIRNVLPKMASWLVPINGVDIY
ncbi:MAG: hypothetical protein E5Y10_25000 [Mesorhizobium sp.]|uniref:hypothetical protein n=1 Tax=Mesorhizobium sp. TaxID=1871066 RepID=UPI001225D096|nr:hypothetical protein [Mesorhizobium sp.]TIN38842.1 MAG: hypothetical protein E5Y13_15420 [Mesorhizobium sp.]TJU85681.1 MAG: hypothetical protein E5Y10_25000 [Mesorhizobium sp.]